MKHRIGLFTSASGKKKKGASTTVSYVEVETANELASKLNALGATHAGLLHRDRAGTTSMKGTMFPVTDLKAEHIDWITGKSESFETRGLFYDNK